MLPQISDAKSLNHSPSACYTYRSCIIGPELSVKVCSIGTVINRSAYASDYCQLEGTTGRQTQPMPIRWMAWESVLLVCTQSKHTTYTPFHGPSSFSCVQQIHLVHNILFYFLIFSLFFFCYSQFCFAHLLHELCAEAQVYNYKLMNSVRSLSPSLTFCPSHWLNPSSPS